MADVRWLLLIHSIPPKPLYLRAKIRQRLVRVGAVALKNSVYVLPRSEDTLEDFSWIAGEARAGAGDAFVCAATFAEGVSDAELVAQFRRERTADYQSLAEELKSLVPGKASEAELAAAAGRGRRKMDEIAAIDFFDAPGRKEAEAMLRKMEGRLRAPEGEPGRLPGTARKDLAGRVWVTRRGVKIDRIASAWLVRRFIDPAARFRFVDPENDVKKPGEIRFDMAGGDFTHEGERCTFETLHARVGLDDPALGPIAEIVHDVDLKDGRYGRPEAAGVRQLVEGLIVSHAADTDRLENGFRLFDALHASFRKRAVPPARRKKGKK